MKDNMPTGYQLTRWLGVDQPVKQVYDMLQPYQVPLTKEEFNEQFSEIFEASKELDKTIQKTLKAFKTNLIGMTSSQLTELKGRMKDSVDELTKQLLGPNPEFEKFEQSLRKEFTDMDSVAFPSTPDPRHESFLESVSIAT